MLVTLRNDFHNTEARVRVRGLSYGPEGELSARQLQRARQKLCGIRGCTCGGIRGHQTAPDGRRMNVDYTVDGWGEDTVIVYVPGE
jgi:hypothetical protein